MHDHFDYNKDEIFSIRAELYQLDVKKAALLRRLNVLESQTAILPTETLSLIFQHFVVSCTPPTKYDPRFPSLFLCSVSHVWRQVARSTPQLWTNLRLYVHPDFAEMYAGLLDLYLSNVCGLLMSLYIGLDSSYTKINKEDPIANVLFGGENLKKIGELKLNDPPPSWLHRLNRPFLQLTKFHLTIYESSYRSLVSLGDTPILTTAPRLREVYLNLPPPSNPPWSFITTLKLDRVPIVAAIRCLLEFQHLTEFHCLWAQEGQEEPFVMPESFTLHHLEILSWPFTSGHIPNLFLQRVRLPSLRSLTWKLEQNPADGPFSSWI